MFHIRVSDLATAAAARVDGARTRTVRGRRSDFAFDPLVRLK